MGSEMTNSKKVMVTGATGYIASWIVKYLLDEGYTIHAAVRNSSDEKKIEHLEKIKSSSKGTIKYFESDLLSPNSYESAMEELKELEEGQGYGFCVSLMIFTTGGRTH